MTDGQPADAARTGAAQTGTAQTGTANAARTGPADAEAGEGASRPAGELRLLFLCTANQCRSPLAEVIAKDQLRRRGIPAEVSSAGFLSGGHEAASGSQNAAKRRGLDLSEHVSRSVIASLVDTSDVVIAMEPGHILDLAGTLPGSQSWSLTLKELVRYARTHGSAGHEQPLTIEQIRSWVRSAGERSLDSLLQDDNTVNDPIGRSDRAFRTTANELDELLAVLFDAWFGESS